MSGGMRYVAAPAVDAKHRAARPPRGPYAREGRTPDVKNVEHVLALGTTRYVRYRAMTIAVPPLPYRRGQRILQQYTRALAVAKMMAEGKGDADAERSYYAALDRLRGLLWRSARPLGWPKRILRRLGIYRNPLRHATEGDLLQLAGFFLQGRTTSSVSPLPEMVD